MSGAQYFYLKIPLKELGTIVESFQESFETMLKDTFSDDELDKFERSLDSIASITVQPIIDELTFDDFYVWDELADSQRAFFESCKSSICLENMPYLQSNPFQVSYLIDLLSKFDEVLIDRGGVQELMYKDPYIEILSKYKKIDTLLNLKPEIPTRTQKVFIPVDQIDFFVVDVYKQIERLRSENKLDSLVIPSEKKLKIFEVMKNERLHTEEILKKSGLGAKDFDDHLEGLKFFLIKI